MGAWRKVGHTNSRESSVALEIFNYQELGNSKLNIIRQRVQGGKTPVRNKPELYQEKPPRGEMGHHVYGDAGLRNAEGTCSYSLGILRALSSPQPSALILCDPTELLSLC